MEKRYETETYVICHNGSDVIHPSKVEAGTFLSTGQPQVEEFDTEESWKARLTELGYNLPTPVTEPAAKSTVVPSPTPQDKFKSIMEKYKNSSRNSVRNN